MADPGNIARIPFSIRIVPAFLSGGFPKLPKCFPKLPKCFPKENKNGFLENQSIKNYIFKEIYKINYSIKITILRRNWMNGEKIGENQRSVFQNRLIVFQKKTFREKRKTELAPNSHRSRIEAASKSHRSWIRIHLLENDAEKSSVTY